MKDEIYERDYYELKQRECELRKGGQDILNITIESGVLNSIEQRLNSMPHVIVPEKKRFYEKCLHLLNAMAIRLGGKIKGTVSYKEYDAKIQIILPFFEFLGEEDMEMFRFIASQSRAVCVWHEDDGNMKLIVYIDYFEAVGDKEKIIDEEIEKHPEIIDYLEKAQESEIDSILADPQIYNMIEGTAISLGVTPKEYLQLFDRALHENPKAIFAAIEEAASNKQNSYTESDDSIV